MSVCLLLTAAISALSGAWVLNKELSTPASAFSPPPSRSSPPPRPRDGGGWRIGSWGNGREPMRRDDEQKQRTQRAAIAELLQPSPRLTITHTDVEVVFVDANGHTRKYKTSGEKQKNQLFASTVETKTKWKDGKLTQEFDVGGAKVTFEYATGASPDQLIVIAKPDDSHAATTVRWVYDRVQ
jgi:hypothetical protein